MAPAFGITSPSREVASILRAGEGLGTNDRPYPPTLSRSKSDISDFDNLRCPTQDTRVGWRGSAPAFYFNYRPIAQTASMVMTIATNCSNTRNCISFWDLFGDPPRIMLIRPSSSTNATAATARGRRIELRNVTIAGT